MDCRWAASLVLCPPGAWCLPVLLALQCHLGVPTIQASLCSRRQELCWTLVSPPTQREEPCTDASGETAKTAGGWGGSTSRDHVTTGVGWPLGTN